MLALTMLASALLSPAAPPGCLCFAHAGVQDKPMPDFCLALPDCHDCGATGREVLVVQAPEWSVVRASVRAEAPPGFGAAQGDYQALSPDGSPAGVVEAKTMRSLVDHLVIAAERQRQAPAELLLRLQARLRPPEGSGR
ncbi:hypothetical protein [Roseateles sp. YR242]|uniref:hypothetical protein n=1 Tax=Roseateles sp. YR242 TaxID=1855305 RepID=UPI00116055A2|nr:hypothetical protein [Roseateles sp. YR242]